MSPSPPPARSASQRACATASPSECPESPISSGHSTQPSHNGVATPKACVSVPSPTRAVVDTASTSASTVILCARSSPATVRTVPPFERQMLASSVKSPDAPAIASAKSDAGNPWGVWTRLSRARSVLSVTMPSSATTMVSTTGTTGITPSFVWATSSTTRWNTSSGVAARATACMRTMSTVGICATAFRTLSVRVSPPGTTRAARPDSATSARTSSRCAGGPAITISSGESSRTTSSARVSRGTPSISTNALGMPRPSRTPDPAATSTSPTDGMGI